MPTKPNENIIPNIEQNPELTRTLTRLSFILDEVLNFGTNLFSWFFENQPRGDHHYAAFALYRRSLELLDTISILIKTSRILPSKIILRSLFETMMYLEYMIKENFEDRGRDYILCLKYKELRILKQHLPGESSYKEYIAMWKKDKIANKMPLPRIPNLKEKIAIKENLINSAYYSSSNDSYLALRKEGKSGEIWWFNLHDGPRNLRELANKLNRAFQYEELYRDWAGYVHGTGILDGQVHVAGKSKIEIIQLRLPKWAEYMTMDAISYELEIMKIMVLLYAQKREMEYKNWFHRELKNDIKWLQKAKIIVNLS